MIEVNWLNLVVQYTVGLLSSTKNRRKATTSKSKHILMEEIKQELVLN